MDEKKDLSGIPVAEMIKTAARMLGKAYTPYSNWKVGAALLSEDGKIWGGCNIENASHGACNCAERTAFYSAISQGEKKFKAIVVLGGKNGIVTDFCAPCGICRQVMMEFCDEDFLVICAVNESDYRVFTLKELLPFGFGPSTLS